MKKISVCIMTLLLSLAFMPIQVKAASESLTTIKTTESEQAGALLARLKEIKGKDRANMSGAERKQLGTEVRSIRHQLNEIGGGIYLSAGAVILIIVLLIIFL